MKTLKAFVDHGENVHAGVEKVAGLKFLKGAYLIKTGVQCLLVVVLGRAPRLALLRLHQLLLRLPPLLLLPRLHRLRHLCNNETNTVSFLHFAHANRREAMDGIRRKYG
jgi:hypothetical protein